MVSTLTKIGFSWEDDVIFGMVGANMFLVVWKIHRKD